MSLNLKKENALELLNKEIEKFERLSESNRIEVNGILDIARESKSMIAVVFGEEEAREFPVALGYWIAGDSEQELKTAISRYIGKLNDYKSRVETWD